MMAGNNPEANLVETIPEGIIRASRRAHLLKVGGPVAVFSLMLPGIPLVAHYSEMAAQTDPYTPVAGAVCMAVFFLVPSLGAVFAVNAIHSKFLRNNRPTTQLVGDRLIVEFGEQRLEARLCDCEFREGPSRKMRLMPQEMAENLSGKRGGVTLYCSQRVLLIDLPPFRKLWFTGAQLPVNTAAVGFTEQAKSTWLRRIQEVVSKQAEEREWPS